MKPLVLVPEHRPEEIARWIDHFLGPGAPKRIVTAEEVRGRTGGAGDDSYWRLVLIDEGRWRIRYSEASGIRAAELAKGDALLLPGNAWYCEDGGSRRTKLFIHFATDHTHVHYSWHRPDAEAHRLVADYRMVPLGSAARHVLRALRELSPGAAAGPALLRGLLCEMRAQFTGSAGEAAEVGKAALVFAKIGRYLESNFHRPITREDVARQFQMHPNHVSRLFRKEGGTTFLEFLTRLRMGRAGPLARAGVFKVDELANTCGYASTATFRKAFRRHHGVSPGRFG